MKEPIRILCVFSTLDRGGAESMCMSLYRTIDRKKVQFDFVKHTNNIGSFEDEIIDKGGRIYIAPRFKVGNIIRYCSWWENHLSTHPEHIIIHGHFYTISAVYFAIAKRHRRITVGHSHNTQPYKKTFSTMIEIPFLYFVERVADYRFACSHAAGKWLYPHKKFRIISNAIDIEEYKYNDKLREKARKDLGINNNTLVIGTVGNIREAKNPFGTIEIFRHVQDMKKDSLLLWAGDGPLYQQVLDKINEYQLDGCIRLLGSRNDVNMLLQAMDVFILPSFYEGLPVVLIEAQAAGLTCIVGDNVTRDVNLTGLCRFLNINDYKSWAEEIINSNKEHKDTSIVLSEAGYNIKTTARWLQNFYLKIYKNYLTVL